MDLEVSGAATARGVGRALPWLVGALYAGHLGLCTFWCARASVRPVLISSQDLLLDAVLDAETRPEASLRVLDLRTFEPVAAVRLRVVAPAQDGRAAIDLEVVTDARGEARASLEPPTNAAPKADGPRISDLRVAVTLAPGSGCVLTSPWQDGAAMPEPRIRRALIDVARLGPKTRLLVADLDGRETPRNSAASAPPLEAWAPPPPAAYVERLTEASSARDRTVYVSSAGSSWQQSLKAWIEASGLPEGLLLSAGEGTAPAAGDATGGTAGGGTAGKPAVLRDLAARCRGLEPGAVAVLCDESEKPVYRAAFGEPIFLPAEP